MTSISAHRYHVLDAIRGAAAFGVLLYHLRIGDPSRAFSGHGGDGLFRSGYLAVDLFFVLSGFVIAHAYEQRLRDGMGIGTFMLARFIRLQPVIALGTLIGLALAIVQRSLHLANATGAAVIGSSIVPNLLMLPNPLVPWGIFLFNPPAWSLFYELIANAAYGATARRLGTLALISVMLMALAALIAGLAWLGDLDRGVVLGEWPIALARVGFSFPLGILLHRTRARWMPRVPRLPMTALLLASIAILAPGFGGAPRVAYDLLFVAILSPLVVMLGAVSQPSTRALGFAAWLGLISYPLYAIHAPIKHWFDTLSSMPRPVDAVCVIVLSLLASTLVATSVDPPVRGAMSRFARRLTHRPVDRNRGRPGLAEANLPVD